MMMSAPEVTEFPQSLKKYVDLIGKEDVFRSLNSQILMMQSAVSDVPEGQEDTTYADSKWSIKEVLGHILDTERLLAYAVLRFSRGDSTPIPGFDAKLYVQNSNPGKASLYDFALSFGRIRETNLSMFKSLNEDQLAMKGIMNGEETTVKALIYVIAGHSLHHINFIKRTYLPLFD